MGVSSKGARRQPDDDTWSALLDATDRLRALAPWKWMGDAEVFGVEDAETGVVGYVSVLGAGGQVHGVCIFEGQRGWASFVAMCEGTADPLDAAYEQHAVTIFFGDREDVDREMLAVFKRLGRKYRGRGAWPQILAHRSGLVPWMPDASEAGFLLRVVAEALPTCERLRQEPTLARGKFLVRRAGVDVLGPRPSVEVRTPVVANLDDVTRRRLAAAPVSGSVWLCDHYFLPGRITDRVPNHWARQAICVDAESGMILDIDVVPFGQEPAAALRDVIVRAMLKLGRPAVIVVRRDAMLSALAPLAGMFRIHQEPDPTPFMHLRDSFMSFTAMG